MPQSPNTTRWMWRTLMQVLCVLTVASNGLAVAAERVVRFGYNGDFQGASLIAVANKLDLWKKHGLVAETRVFTNGPLQVQALGTGDLDFGYVGPGALWLPMLGKARIVAINSIAFADRIIAQPGIKSMHDLQGKTVAVPEGTSGDMLLRIALRDAGMHAEDIKRVAMDPATIVTAFAAGQVDAAGIWYPHVATIKRRVPNLVELFGNKDAMPKNSFPTAFVMRTDLDNPADEAFVEAVVGVIKEANDWRKNNLAQTVELTASLLNAPKASLEAEAAYGQYFSSQELSSLTADGTVAGWLRGMNELFKSFGRLTETVATQKYYLAPAYIAARP